MKRWIVLILTLTAGVAWAKVDLVTLPRRDWTQLTVYNSADLTLVRERRQLTLKEGINKLQFSWANTLIDPTSLELLPLEKADKIEVLDLDYPPGVKDLGLWTIDSEQGGKASFEITCFTSGISWRAFYMGTLSKDETTMRLEGYVRVTNHSGEDYENARTRLIVGKIHLLDQIAMLARRQYPYGAPQTPRPLPPPSPAQHMDVIREAKMKVESRAPMLKAKEIKKEGLSEYFLYTIEGSETIPNGWSKRLPSFEKDQVPVVNLYKYEEERYGRQCIRFLSFDNDKAHKLGDTPIPGGAMRVFRVVDEKERLSYEGRSSFKYIPVDEEVELNLGAAPNVLVEPTMMGVKEDNWRFDKHGDISGRDETRDFRVIVKNTRDIRIRVEATRNVASQCWSMKRTGDFGKYEKVDLDTVKFTLELPPGAKKEFHYSLTIHHGARCDEK